MSAKLPPIIQDALELHGMMSKTNIEKSRQDVAAMDLLDERSERAQEEQQARRDQYTADVRKEIMDQLRQSPSTWREGMNEHALSVAALFQEQDILQCVAKNINTTGGKEIILKHVIKIFKDAVEDHLDEYLDDMK